MYLLQKLLAVPQKEFIQQLTAVCIESFETLVNSSTCSDSTKAFFKNYTPNSPLPVFLSIIEPLCNQNDISLEFKKTIIDYMTAVMPLAIKQHQADPVFYVSHDFRHSIAVVNYAEQLFDNCADFKQACIQYIKHECATLPDNDVLIWSKFMLLTACYEHDIGYPVQAERGLSKASHSIIGAQQSESYIASLRKRFLTKAGIPPSVVELLKNKILDLILYHNADVKQKLSVRPVYNYELPFGFLASDSKPEKSNFKQAYGCILSCCVLDLEFGRTADVLAPNDGAAIIAFRPASLTDSASCFDAAVRIADNCDSTFSRLSSDQQQLTQAVFKQLVSQLRYQDQDKPKIIEFSDASISAIYDIQIPLARQLSMKELNYFLAIMSIVDINFKFKSEGNLQIHIIQDEHVCNVLSKFECKTATGDQVDVINFYPDRITSAFESIRFKNQPIEVVCSKAKLDLGLNHLNVDVALLTLDS